MEVITIMKDSKVLVIANIDEESLMKIYDLICTAEGGVENISDYVGYLLGQGLHLELYELGLLSSPNNISNDNLRLSLLEYIEYDYKRHCEQLRNITERSSKFNRSIGFIYGLYNPSNDLIYYVGQTKNLYKRFMSHINEKNDNTLKGQWVTELKSKGVFPKMTILEEVEYSQLLRRERYWINDCIKLGHPLLNDR